ncbi:dehydrogenase [Cryobacterium sp. MLB-32]|uniref:2-oxo acid dehydrogenase subunit E2 n=1 Tax=Cryobacterium sp. MLB-32 TaxID=1529318 RepID=UPI0004E709DE|nr:2-oxo acid dehydrogenase subunit E2 [Cryobacterium sp. MLB-32]KFF61094.1 dehydrogenase [Cryobacterium sp. MLB-32]
MGEFRMPSLGADMEQGKIVEWLVKPGDYVHRGDLVAVVDTDKADIDVESFEEGVIAELLVDIGMTVPVGTALARIVQTPAAGAEPAAATPTKRPSAAKRSADTPPAEIPGAPRPAPAMRPAPLSPTPSIVSPPVRHLAHQLGVDTRQVRGTGAQGALTREDVENAAAARPLRPAAVPLQTPDWVRSSPRARKVAAELGIDLVSVSGTGPNGAITEADVRAARHPVPAPPAVPEPAVPEPVVQNRPVTSDEPTRKSDGSRAESLRRAVGTLMARSKKTIPHYYLSSTIDMGAALEWMRTANKRRSISSRLVPSVLLLKAAALAAAQVPEMNGFYTDNRFTPSTEVHLGVAVALRHGGLVAPAIHDANALALDDLMDQLKDLVGRARSGHLQRSEMADPTITVTNLGDLGVDAVFGVIYPPQVALVGFGAVTEQPVARGGLLGVRPVVTATLSADHRVSDGLRGARFLTMIAELMQKPEEL